MKGTVYIVLSAICFSLGGILIKLIPWSSMSIQGIRSVFSFFIIGGYMVLTHHKFVFNKSVLFGGICNAAMATAFVGATKMTTAANAIVLQFTAPIFVILLTWMLFKKKPGKDAIVACAVVFIGIIFFFFESLSGGAMVGNLLAVFSGLTYALVMMLKEFEGADFESSMMLSNVFCAVIGVPYLFLETEQSASIWFFALLLGVFQYGFAYIFMSKGLDYVSPVTTSLICSIEPILNPVLVAAFYGESIGKMAVVGAVLVVGAATIYNLKQAKEEE